MVYKYKRKTDRATSWSEGDMAKAIDAVKNGTSIRRASVQFGIKFSTLQRHVKNDSKKKVLGRYKPVFSTVEELEFVEYLKDLDNRFYGLTRRDLCELAYQYAEKNRIAHPFKNGMAGEQWYQNFMRRHPELKLRQPEPTSIARARGFNRPQVEVFFRNLKSVLDKHRINLDNIYNVDETGIQTSAKKPPRVISLVGKKQVGSISSAERGTLITALCCCSATGKYIPPALVFPRKKKNPRYLNGCPPGTLGLVTDSGWISTDTFLEWLQFFVQSVRPSPDNKCLLILDNHSSHRAIKVLDYAYENNVVLLTVPPHTTHKLQPLDVAVYGPFGKYFEFYIDRWQKAHPSQHVTFFDIGEIFSEAYLKAATPSNAISGFTKSGIANCDINVFTDLDFLPSQVTEVALHEEQTQHSENDLTFYDEPTNLNQRDEQKATTSKSGGSNVSSTDPINNNESLLSNVNDEGDASGYVLHPDNSDNNDAPCMSAVSVIEKKIRLSDLRPMPKCDNRSKKARRTQKSEVLTSTPVKEEIRLQAQTAKKKQVKRKISEDSQPPAVVRRPQRPKEIFSPEEASVPCLICNDTFGNSASGEKWIQCNMCQQWAHQLCTDYKSGVYICDNCQQQVLSSRT